MNKLLLGILLYTVGQALIWYQTNGQFVCMLTFTILTNYYMGEGINAKTAISLVLACTLVLIQILWK